MLNTNFTGRIFQVVEALDYGDAVSNQVVAMDVMFKSAGFESQIYSRWHHPDVENLRSSLDDLTVTDEDIVILHYAGFSVYAYPHVEKLRCTKVCVYHNITPHTFFEAGTDLYDFCLKGREQLVEVVNHCHYFWGDSQYNLQELIGLGAHESACSLVPIVVPDTTANVSHLPQREPGTWLFLGRIAGNKGHHRLVKVFADARAKNPAIAQKLYIVGNHNPADPYYKGLIGLIESMHLQGEVVLTGKVSNDDVENYFAKASVYVSLSQHEGFGVPLIESAHRGLPVVALDTSAVGETLGDTSCLATHEDGLLPIVEKLLLDKAHYDSVVRSQKLNSKRFKYSAVNANLLDAVRKIIPGKHQFSTVSIVICTFNRCDLLDRCLDYLKYQSNQNFEVVVVNGPSTDATETVLARYAGRIKVAQNPLRNLSVSRNMGIEISSGDLIAFIDDDALPFDDWVETLLLEFGRRPLTHAALGGPAYFAGSLDFQAQDIAINKFAEAQVNVDSSLIGHEGWERSMLGTNTCFRGDIIRSVGGFDRQFDYFLDESELSYRLQKRGFIVGYAPELYLRHEFAQSENRGGKYKFNWFSICKNMAYYIAAYSGLTGSELEHYVAQRMIKERINPILAGFEAGEIPLAEKDAFVSAIETGAWQGLADYKKFPQTETFVSSPGPFRTFCSAPNYPLVHRDIRPLHICIVTKEFPPFVKSGGIGTLYYHLASELLLMGHHVTVIAPGDLDPIHTRGRFALKYARTRAICHDAQGTPGFINNLNWSLSALEAVAKIHEDHPIDVIDSALWDSEALGLALLPKGKRPPVVVRLVTPFPVAARLNGWSVPEYEDGLFKAAESRLIHDADAIVPISESICSTIEHEYGIHRDARWHISHCGLAYWPFFDFRLGYAALGEVNGKPLVIPADSKILLFVGRLESRKGVDVLLNATAEFLGSDKTAHLVLAGRDIEGFTGRAESMIPSEILERVHFVGEVDDSTRDKLLHVAHCVIFPSRYESFGLVPLEANVHGVPVVASRAGAIPEVVIDGTSGLLFTADSPSDLARCVIRMLTEPGLRDSLSLGALAQIRKMSSRNSAIRAITLYADLVPSAAI